ncbi:hypothetical protein PC129_g17853 [Phytophthora cactorum]|uniref:Uncharacterized protein n=1 Tax=Phytophthora cactorum TaxID=29920 RepID=A0A8T1HGV2_9STRA|nr:hypothetical protein PC111_g18226 [Phytophthora cactorum]KAG3211166.1 hypothetical protein PC129_g17853 [Phytophthora cactorum]
MAAFTGYVKVITNTRSNSPARATSWWYQLGLEREVQELRKLRTLPEHRLGRIDWELESMKCFGKPLRHFVYEAGANTAQLVTYIRFMDKCIAMWKMHCAGIGRTSGEMTQ